MNFLNFGRFRDKRRHTKEKSRSLFTHRQPKQWHVPSSSSSLIPPRNVDLSSTLDSVPVVYGFKYQIVVNRHLLPVIPEGSSTTSLSTSPITSSLSDDETFYSETGEMYEVY